MEEAGSGMNHLDPDDLAVIEEAKKAGSILVTWDRPLREAAGGMTPYEAMDKVIQNHYGMPELEDALANATARSLGPRELTALATSAADTGAWFRVNIRVEGPNTVDMIRRLRIENGYSWRSIARLCAYLWGCQWGSNQLAGMVICEKAAKALGQDFMEPPWN